MARGSHSYDGWWHGWTQAGAATVGQDVWRDLGSEWRPGSCHKTRPWWSLIFCQTLYGVISRLWGLGLCKYLHGATGGLKHLVVLSEGGLVLWSGGRFLEEMWASAYSSTASRSHGFLCSNVFDIGLCVAEWKTSEAHPSGAWILYFGRCTVCTDLI